MPAQAWTSVHAFHEEARHCQGRSEELSADGMFDRASIRTRWSSLRTRCSMKFDLAALLSLSRPLRTGRGLAVAANSVCPFALLRFLNLLQSDVLPQPPSIRRSSFPPSIRRSYVPASIRRSFLRSGISRLTAATRVVGRRLVPVIPFPSYKSCSPIGPEQSRARRARRSEPWTARTDLESCQQRERGFAARSGLLRFAFLSASLPLAGSSGKTDRSPHPDATAGASAQPVCAPPPRSLCASRKGRRVPPIPVPSAASPNLPRDIPECIANIAPAVAAIIGHRFW